ncbi:MAG: hypothetical protein JRG89_05150 [Deltaproteobacteria bacterium]|nr:hypothetical protein [Deltaproteobacteria bacterium]MBW2387805.1 hypothetical protein [Deltaproteobacteria bacterium]MBW2723119.1 hypothetical protein [Deltaproteobacteria bacterium]
MLPLLYPDSDTREALLADPSTAPIPQLHRELFRFAEKFVRGSWTMGSEDLQRLREAGLSDADIVQWATLGSTQSWFTMSADGGGIPMDGDALTGPGVGRTRDSYEATPGGLLAASDDAPFSSSAETDGAIAWVTTDESAKESCDAASWAEQRYDCVPNLFRAVSLQPSFYRRHRLALQLLEAPQSESLSARHHAMVRVLVSHLGRSRYSAPTSRALLSQIEGGDQLVDRICKESLDDALGSDWSPIDRTVLSLAAKFARNAYKVTDKDAIGLREAGLDDEAYVDILNTVSIQTSLDRLANALGVRPDPVPLLPGC